MGVGRVGLVVEFGGEVGERGVGHDLTLRQRRSGEEDRDGHPSPLACQMRPQRFAVLIRMITFDGRFAVSLLWPSSMG